MYWRNNQLDKKYDKFLTSDLVLTYYRNFDTVLFKKLRQVNKFKSKSSNIQQLHLDLVEKQLG